MALFIVSTPIGNLEDITIRALKILFNVPVILAEDTRHTGNLLEHYRNKWRDSFPFEMEFRQDFKPKLISFHEHNEQRKIMEIIGILREGTDVAMVSDAGTPLVSDPGFKLVRQCMAEKIRVISLPGPSAWLTALTSSGMPTDRVFMLGYFSPRSIRRRKELHQLKNAFAQLRKPPTIVFFESPHRLLSILRDILEIAGNIEVTLASELTKLHEKVATKPVSLWIAELGKQKKIRGEYTVLFRF